ncbi:hypothetical protein HDU93_001384 [Gonapodya sp. JEL0774]|nr:hypothetical protein HDU93_001384 [Gonapodya sp. JEL0774]
MSDVSTDPPDAETDASDADAVVKSFGPQKHSSRSSDLWWGELTAIADSDESVIGLDDSRDKIATNAEILRRLDEIEKMDGILDERIKLVWARVAKVSERLAASTASGVEERVQLRERRDAFMANQFLPEDISGTRNSSPRRVSINSDPEPLVGFIEQKAVFSSDLQEVLSGSGLSPLPSSYVEHPVPIFTQPNSKESQTSSLPRVLEKSPREDASLVCQLPDADLLPAGRSEIAPNEPSSVKESTVEYDKNLTATNLTQFNSSSGGVSHVPVHSHNPTFTHATNIPGEGPASKDNKIYYEYKDSHLESDNRGGGQDLSRPNLKDTSPGAFEQNAVTLSTLKNSLSATQREGVKDGVTKANATPQKSADQVVNSRLRHGSGRSKASSLKGSQTNITNLATREGLYQSISNSFPSPESEVDQNQSIDKEVRSLSTLVLERERHELIADHSSRKSSELDLTVNIEPKGLTQTEKSAHLGTALSMKSSGESADYEPRNVPPVGSVVSQRASNGTSHSPNTQIGQDIVELGGAATLAIQTTQPSESMATQVQQPMNQSPNIPVSPFHKSSMIDSGSTKTGHSEPFVRLDIAGREGKSDNMMLSGARINLTKSGGTVPSPKEVLPLNSPPSHGLSMGEMIAPDSSKADVGTSGSKNGDSSSDGRHGPASSLQKIPAFDSELLPQSRESHLLKKVSDPDSLSSPSHVTSHVPVRPKHFSQRLSLSSSLSSISLPSSLISLATSLSSLSVNSNVDPSEQQHPHPPSQPSKKTTRRGRKQGAEMRSSQIHDPHTITLPVSEMRSNPTVEKPPSFPSTVHNALLSVMPAFSVSVVDRGPKSFSKSAPEVRSSITEPPESRGKPKASAPELHQGASSHTGGQPPVESKNIIVESSTSEKGQPVTPGPQLASLKSGLQFAASSKHVLSSTSHELFDNSRPFALNYSFRSSSDLVVTGSGQVTSAVVAPTLNDVNPPFADSDHGTSPGLCSQLDFDTAPVSLSLPFESPKQDELSIATIPELDGRGSIDATVGESSSTQYSTALVSHPDRLDVRDRNASSERARAAMEQAWEEVAADSNRMRLSSEAALNSKIHAIGSTSRSRGSSFARLVGASFGSKSGEFEVTSKGKHIRSGTNGTDSDLSTTSREGELLTQAMFYFLILMNRCPGREPQEFDVA